MSRFSLAATAMLLVVASAAPTLAGHSPETEGRFPSSDPDVRVGTPDDPDFDCAEADDEDTSKTCSTVWEEQYNLFGFAPDSTSLTAPYRDPGHLSQGILSQISGVSADRAWKTSIGDPGVDIAIIDTGIVWNRAELRKKIWLNAGELPLPLVGDPVAATHDANSDGAFDVDDYAADPRVNFDAGPQGIAGVVDGQDLIAAFSDGVDDDGNGYVDDIAGWDFFDDDNDPFDASSYSSAGNHGSGRAEEAGRETHDGRGEAGVCPRCRLMMLRVWDSFIPPADHYAMATLYAADNGAEVQEVALGVLQNSRFSQAATQYAFERGVALMQVSSDLNTSNHNYPTNYNNTIFVAGTVADAHGLGENNEQLAAFLRNFGMVVGSQVPVGTWFRNSNLTQFGGHAHIVMVGSTGSQATGQAAGAAGLVMSAALENGVRLTSNEVKQILTLTAEDVLPENTVGTGIPDHAQPGWDQHFGYGRPDLGLAVARAASGPIPPEAGIEGPPWFHILDPASGDVPVEGFASSRSGAFTYELAYGIGVEPLEGAFTVFETGASSSGIDGALGALPVEEIAARIPGAADGVPPAHSDQYAFTVRLRVRDAADPSNLGEDRKTLFVFHDPDLHEGWPSFIDTGGESSLRFADLDGDGSLEIIAANTSGEIEVLNHDGTRAAFFNGGAPFQAEVTTFLRSHLSAPAFANGAVEPGRGGFTTPAIGDLDGDGYPEIVAANGERVYALKGDGSLLEGFPATIDEAFSAPELRTRSNHLKTGIFSSPALGDLDSDGLLDIVVAAMDQRAYAWSHKGALLDGWPVFLSSGDAGAESVNTPAIADIDGDGSLDVIVATNEIYGASPPAGLEEAIREGLINLASGAVGLTSRLYAIHHDGTLHDGDPDGSDGWEADPDAFLDGWPVTLNGLADLLPLVGPGVDAVVADVDPSSEGLEVINGSFSGDWIVIGADGTARYPLQSVAPGGSNVSGGVIINTAEHAAVGDTTGLGGLSIFKGGLPAEGAVNLLLVGQNVPFTHVLQGWDAATGSSLPGWPRAIDDFQIFTGPAIADVGGAPDREVIQGSGLHLIHAFGPGGLDAPGFPKFTGGWIIGVTNVGDVDGDGALEIANWTREGNMFLWDTEAQACGGNDEWWTFRHDDYSSGAYGTDSRPPSAVTDLTASSEGGPPAGGPPGAPGRGKGAGKGKGPVRTVTLDWTAPGEDHGCGVVLEIEARSSLKPILTHADWESASVVEGGPEPGEPGSAQTVTLTTRDRHFAVRSIDDAGNLSPLSNSVSVSGSSASPRPFTASEEAGPGAAADGGPETATAGLAAATAAAALLLVAASLLLRALRGRRSS